jgi:hypothetical protein
MCTNNLMKQQNRFVDLDSPIVKNADVWTERPLYFKEHVSNGLILQSQFSDLSNACSAPNDIQITESAVNMWIIDCETSFHR